MGMPDLILTLRLFFNDTATTEIYTLSLHDALPIFRRTHRRKASIGTGFWDTRRSGHSSPSDRKSTRLNSSHANISYAVFCLKKNKIKSPKLENHLPGVFPTKVDRRPIGSAAAPLQL